MVTLLTSLYYLIAGSVPDGLALDCNTNTIFYTDTNRDIISTIDYNGNNEQIIVNEDLDEPRAIVLDINRRYVYKDKIMGRFMEHAEQRKQFFNTTFIMETKFTKYGHKTS